MQIQDQNSSTPSSTEHTSESSSDGDNTSAALPQHHLQQGVDPISAPGRTASHQFTRATSSDGADARLVSVPSHPLEIQAPRGPIHFTANEPSEVNYGYIQHGSRGNISGNSSGGPMPVSSRPRSPNNPVEAGSGGAFTQLENNDTSDESDTISDPTIRPQPGPSNFGPTAADATRHSRFQTGGSYPTFLPSQTQESQLVQAPQGGTPFSPLPALSSRPPMPLVGAVSPLVELPLKRPEQASMGYMYPFDHQGYRMAFAPHDPRPHLSASRSGETMGQAEGFSRLTDDGVTRGAAFRSYYVSPQTGPYPIAHEDYPQHQFVSYPPYLPARSGVPYAFAADASFEPALHQRLPESSQPGSYREGTQESTQVYGAPWTDSAQQHVGGWQGASGTAKASNDANLSSYSGVREAATQTSSTDRDDFLSTSSSEDEYRPTASRNKLRKRKSQANLKSRKTPGRVAQSSSRETIASRRSSSSSIYRQDAIRRGGARLIRTSELSQADASFGLRHMSRRRMAHTTDELGRAQMSFDGVDGGGPDPALPITEWRTPISNRQAALIIDGNLDLVTRHWSMDETVRKRRLVRFHRLQVGGSIRLGFDVITQDQYQENETATISCIWWTEEAGYYVTSVDCISLLEFAIGQPFSIEEKNRIRRNLEAVKPVTISKNRPESQAFFRLIMNFEPPRPRNIEKDVKVFTWSQLEKALKKIISKYSVSYFYHDNVAPF